MGPNNLLYNLIALKHNRWQKAVDCRQKTNKAPEDLLFFERELALFKMKIAFFFQQHRSVLPQTNNDHYTFRDRLILLQFVYFKNRRRNTHKVIAGHVGVDGRTTISFKNTNIVGTAGITHLRVIALMNRPALFAEFLVPVLFNSSLYIYVYINLYSFALTQNFRYRCSKSTYRIKMRLSL